MEEPMYPTASKDIAKKREELAPEILKTFRAFSHQVFVDGGLPSKTKELIAVGGGPRDAVPLLHSQPYQERTIERCHRMGDHGSHLGRRRDAGWRRNRTLRARYRRDEQGKATSK